MGEVGAATATATVEQALEVLRLDWGGIYQIGHDDERGWWAAPHGRRRYLLTEDSPEELRAAMAADFGPVKP